MIRPAISPKPKMRKCCICKERFQKRSMSHTACKPECAQEAAKRKREKIEKRNLLLAKQGLKPRSWWLAKARTALHAFIRARDEGKSCISCATILVKAGRVGGDYDAGHFRSVGSAKHLQFVENNIHGQCKHCNDHLKGNQLAYEQGLIKRYGLEYVEALKADQTPRHYTIDDFKAIEATYKAKLKQLREATC